MENLKNGLQNETGDGFINPIFEIEVIKDKITEISIKEQVTKLPLLFIVHQYLKDYGFCPNVNENFVVILRLGPGGEIRMPLFLKTLPDNWAQGANIPGAVLYEKPAA